MAVTIYHNPRCSKSRQTLALINAAGIAHTIILYLETAPDAATILGLAQKLKLPVTDLLRRGESTFKEANELPESGDDTEWANWLAAHPIVLQRPIIVDDDSGAAVIGRPPENVQQLLSH